MTAAVRTVPYRRGEVRLTETHVAHRRDGLLSGSRISIPLHQVRATRVEVRPPGGALATAITAFAVTVCAGSLGLFDSGIASWLLVGTMISAFSISLFSLYAYLTRREAILVIASEAEAIELSERWWASGSLSAFADEVRRCQAGLLHALALGERRVARGDVIEAVDRDPIGFRKVEPERRDRVPFVRA